MERKKMFIYIGILWILIILGFFAFKEYTLRTGQEVLLKTIPVDPQDLFRGDYVFLNYEISTITIPTGPIVFKEGDKAYLWLGIKDGYGVDNGISKERPKGIFYIKGDVVNVTGSILDLRFGIESYFVPEGKGKVLEKEAGNGLDVKVSIDRFGNAVIKSVLIDGKEVGY